MEAAPLLLGWILVRQTPRGIIKLKIVETEAYHQDDPASHSFRGRTERTAPMFEAGGRLYIYFTYGMHHAINIVTGQKGVGEAVLLRAAELLEGIKIMQKNRTANHVKGPSFHTLADGPGKLTQALGIKDTSLSGKLLNAFDSAQPRSAFTMSKSTKGGRVKLVNKSSIFLEQPIISIDPKDIVSSPRIGIRHATDALWRFYLKDNPFVTKHRYNKSSG